MIEYTRPRPEFWNNIYLIGYMGTGKTSTARQLGRLLGKTVIDLDEVISDFAQESISQIFEERGENYFRDLETLILATAITGSHVKYDLIEGAVFSTGGGAVLSEINVAAMRNTGHLVWLTATPETILDRLSGDSSRPLLDGKMNIEDIREMMSLREPYYREAADIEIATDGKTPEEVAGEIMATLGLYSTVS